MGLRNWLGQLAAELRVTAGSQGMNENLAEALRGYAVRLDQVQQHLQQIGATRWKPASEPPVCAPGRSIQVLAVVDDESLALGDNPEPFVDIATWWPDTKRWTVTHCTRAAPDAVDHPVTVRCWDDMPQLPARLP